MFIVSLEGIDASGKSTLFYAIQEMNTLSNVCFYKTPYMCNAKSLEVKLKADNYKLEFLERFLLYSSGNIAPLIEARLKKYNIVLLDRFFLSTLVYSLPVEDLVYDEKINMDKLKKILRPMKGIMYRADAMFYVYVDYKEWHKRIYKRSKNIQENESQLLEQLTPIETLNKIKKIMDFIATSEESKIFAKRVIILKNNTLSDMKENITRIQNVLYNYK